MKNYIEELKEKWEEHPINSEPILIPSNAEELELFWEDIVQSLQSVKKEAVEEYKNQISLKLCNILNTNLWEIEAEREIAGKEFINPTDLKRITEYIEYFLKDKELLK